MRNQRSETLETKRDGGIESGGSATRRRDVEEGGSPTRKIEPGAGGTERQRESISPGNSNLHLFYYIIIPTRRSISGALKRRFSNRFARNFSMVNFERNNLVSRAVLRCSKKKKKGCGES